MTGCLTNFDTARAVAAYGGAYELNQDDAQAQAELVSALLVHEWWSVDRGEQKDAQEARGERRGARSHQQ